MIFLRLMTKSTFIKSNNCILHKDYYYLIIVVYDNIDLEIKK